jgi:hypothetical protein
MDVVAAPYLAAALLLVVAGVAKALDPLSLVRALRAAGLTVRAPLLMRFVRVAAVFEAAVGAAAIVAPSRTTALAVAASYAGFTLFVLQALRTGSPLASCGCFGKVDTPPTRLHAIVTGVLAMLALVAAGRPGVELGLGLLVVTAVLAYLTYLVLAVLPLVTQKATR